MSRARRPSSAERGHTLLELIATLALAAILACAVLGLCRVLMRQAKTAGTPLPAFETRLRTMVAEELSEAEQLERVPAGFALTGPIRPKPDPKAEGHRPLRVVWRIEDGRLVREETDLLSGQALRQTVVAGIDRAELVKQGTNYQVTLSGAALSQALVFHVAGEGR